MISPHFLLQTLYTPRWADFSASSLRQYIVKVSNPHAEDLQSSHSIRTRLVLVALERGSLVPHVSADVDGAGTVEIIGAITVAVVGTVGMGLVDTS